ncbi:MAG: prepilin-type N-terminal cleavage/methylation domain-containing protein [Desulfatiglandaceae bacterium]
MGKKREGGRWRSSPGFTLVELLIAMAIAGIVMAGTYSVYRSQQSSYAAQTQVTALEQKVRAAMFYMQRDISMAGCDPSGHADAGILTADSHSIRLTEDLNGNGDPSENNEDISYSLYTSKGIQKLGRKTPFTASNQPVVEDVDSLNFVYLDKAGNVLPTPVADASKIRSIQITLVVRAEAQDPHYTNMTVYVNQQGQTVLGLQKDHFRRRLMTAEVLCRNLAF